jgi:hypothetical protein
MHSTLSRIESMVRARECFAANFTALVYSEHHMPDIARLNTLVTFVDTRHGGAQWLNAFKKYMENPMAMLL